MNFYNAIWILCKKKGMSISKFAREMGVSRQTIDHFKHHGMNLATLKKYSDAFGVSLTEFIQLAEESDEQA